MKASVDKVEGLTRLLRVEVPVDQVKTTFEKALKTVQKTATIKGFRKGKAPIATIRSMYGEEVKSDVLNELINRGYQFGLDQHSLDPIGYPKVDFKTFDANEAFSFSAEFEVRPEIQITKFEGLEVESEKLEISEDRIQKVLQNVQESNAEHTLVLEDRGLAMGDFAEIDFDGKVDGKPLQGGQAENHVLEIGANRFIEGFEEALVGMKPSQTRELNLKFPEDYHSADIAGKPVHFTVKLKAIKKKSLPEINDELAQKAGPFKTLQELKDAVRADMEGSEKQRIQEDLKNKVLRELVKQNPMEAPKSLVQQQKETLIQDVQQKMQKQGLSQKDFEDYKTKWDADFEDTARFMVCSTFLIDSLALKLNLQATSQDLTQKLNEYAAQTGIELARLNEFYADSERRSRLSFQVTEEKVVNHLIEKAKIKEVPAQKNTEE